MSCPASAGHRVRRSQRKSIAKPILHLAEDGAIATEHPELRTYRLFTEGSPALLFRDNETNVRRLYDQQGVQGHFKDAFSEYVVNGNHDAVNPNRTGTKAAAQFGCEAVRSYAAWI